MKIAVTGGAGFVGEEIVKQARAGGFEVRVIVRDLKRALWLEKQYGAELAHGNVIHAPSLEGTMNGVSVVVHLVGIIHERKENTFERVHTEGTINVVDATKKAGVKRYIHMSALGTRANARSDYHRTKWAAEEYVRKSGLAWTVFRPSVIYGPRDKSINVLAKVVRLAPFVPVLGSGKSKVQPVSVENVAKAFAGAIKNENSIGKTYDLCGPEEFTWNELYDKIMRVLGIQKRKVHMPLALARIQAAVFETLLPNPPFTRDQLLMVEEDNNGDGQPAVHEFFLEQENFELGISRYFKKNL